MLCPREKRLCNDSDCLRINEPLFNSTEDLSKKLPDRERLVISFSIARLIRQEARIFEVDLNLTANPNGFTVCPLGFLTSELSEKLGVVICREAITIIFQNLVNATYNDLRQN